MQAGDEDLLSDFLFGWIEGRYLHDLSLSLPFFCWGGLGITLPDVYQACERFKAENVQFQKSPNQGGMKGLAFIKDPDGYWIEIIHQGEPRKEKPEVDCLGVHIKGGSYSGGGGGGGAAPVVAPGSSPLTGPVKIYYWPSKSR